MSKIKDYSYLHILLFGYSFCNVFSKLASTYPFMSKEFIIYYFISLLILGVYAILWQQILKKFPLTTAFINKSVTIIWGMILGFIFFNETITLKMIIGAIIILIGVSVVIKNE